MVAAFSWQRVMRVNCLIHIHFNKRVSLICYMINLFRTFQTQRTSTKSDCKILIRTLHVRAWPGEPRKQRWPRCTFDLVLDGTAQIQYQNDTKVALRQRYETCSSVCPQTCCDAMDNPTSADCECTMTICSTFFFLIFIKKWNFTFGFLSHFLISEPLINAVKYNSPIRNPLKQFMFELRCGELLFLFYVAVIGRHGDAVVNTVASQQDGSGFISSLSVWSVSPSAFSYSLNTCRLG